MWKSFKDISKPKGRGSKYDMVKIQALVCRLRVARLHWRTILFTFVHERGMKIPSFVGPLVSAVLFLSVLFAFWFYYCYLKPKRQRKKNQGCNNTANPESPSLSGCRSRAAAKSSSYDEECFYGYGSGLSAYSAGYCFHGGFPMVNLTSYEQRWQPPKKMRDQASLFNTKIEQCNKQNKACCELRVDDIIKARIAKKPCISRQFSSESHGARKSCHLQVIQECEEEKEENKEKSEIKDKDLGSGEVNDFVAT